MLPPVAQRRFDCVLADTKDAVVAEANHRAGGKIEGWTRQQS
jgi:type I restriction enzyme M protein